MLRKILIAQAINISFTSTHKVLQLQSSPGPSLRNIHQKIQAKASEKLPAGINKQMLLNSKHDILQSFLSDLAHTSRFLLQGQ